jgi:hypothetical protein
MDKNVSDVLGVVLLVLVLAGGVSLGVFSTVRSDLFARSYEVLLEDKTAQTKYSSDLQDYDYDGTLSRGEVFVATLIQDDGMSGSGTMQLGSNTLTVQKVPLTAYLDTYTEYANTFLQGSPASASIRVTCRYLDGVYLFTKD